MKSIYIAVMFACIFTSLGHCDSLSSKSDEILNPFLGSAYRVDGVDNSAGEHTLFEDQMVRFDTAGYNCSGFVVSAVRLFLGDPLRIDDARKDINGNSGKGAAYGQDWDFGRDLILNIASRYSYRVVMPIGDDTNVDLTAFDSIGFNLHDEHRMGQVIDQVVKDRLYLIAFSKATSAKGYRYLYYHVALMVMDSKGAVWLYHSTPDEGVHRIQMDTDAGMAKFQEAFKYNGVSPKRLLILEVTP